MVFNLGYAVWENKLFAKIQQTILCDKYIRISEGSPGIRFTAYILRYVNNTKVFVIDGQSLHLGILGGRQEQAAELPAGSGGKYSLDPLHIIAHGNDAHPFAAERLEHFVGVKAQLVFKGGAHSAVDAETFFLPPYGFRNIEATGINIVSVCTIGAALIEKLAQALADTGKIRFLQQGFAVDPVVCGFRGMVFSENPAYIPCQRQGPGEAGCFL
jgi:hypothetical protein